MKNLSLKIVSLLLLLLNVTFLTAQTSSLKALSQELHALQKQLVPDKRVAILEIELKDTLQTPFVVSGRTDLRDAKEAVTRFFTSKNLRFIDSIKVLPDASLGDKTWALASLSVSNLRSQPGHAAELVSQALMGTPMKVLDKKDGWLLVQTPEHYIGWMEASQLKRLSQIELDNWKKADRYLYNRLSGTAFNAPKESAEIMSDLVLGDLFEVEGKKKKYLKFRTPDGRAGYVKKKDCISFKEWSQSEPKAPAVLSVAKSMTGVPYLWGGSSIKGVDCSGLVKVAFYSKGIILARDASQQARYGEKIDFNNVENLKAGDLLFFGPSVQRVVHVGIYTDNGDFINSSGWVQMSSILSSDPKYLSRNLVGACRVFNSQNTEGITRVKDHPWYSSQH